MIFVTLNGLTYVVKLCQANHVHIGLTLYGQGMYFSSSKAHEQAGNFSTVGQDEDTVPQCCRCSKFHTIVLPLECLGLAGVQSFTFRLSTVPESLA